MDDGDLTANVVARVETIRPGDRVYTPKGTPIGYVVDRVTDYGDGTHVVTYRTGVSSSMRFGDVMCRTADVLGSLRPLKTGERWPCRRGAPPDPV